jgi:hypothetical protein
MRDALRIGWVAMALLLLGAAPALSSWHDLRSVKVTVSNPSLPPPGGKPQTASFLPGHGLKRAQRALNANHIVRAAQGIPVIDCAGGFTVVIKVVKRSGTRVGMSAYRCGGMTFGRIGGNLPGFLKAVGISPP